MELWLELCEKKEEVMLDEKMGKVAKGKEKRKEKKKKKKRKRKEKEKEKEKCVPLCS